MTVGLCNYAHCMEVNCSCKSGKGEFSSIIRLHSGYYHDRYEELTKEFVPDLIIAPNVGIATYRSWSPTIVCLMFIGADKRNRDPSHFLRLL
nr:zinc finger MYND domain-containing protein 15 isoform X1 [Tanacetum cinerariifolium]